MRMYFIGIMIISLVTLGLPFPLTAAESPRWSFAFQGGIQELQIDNWDSVYSDRVSSFGIDLGRKFSKQFALHLGLNYLSEEANARTASGRTSSDTVNIKLLPVEISLKYRLIINTDQLFVPFTAIGFTHTFYRVKLNNDKRTGDQSGYHARAGIQLLLDRIKPASSRKFLKDWGIYNTYLFIEYYFSQVDDFGGADQDLGAEGLGAGLIFEF